MLNSDKSTKQIEKRVASLKLGKPYQRETLNKYVATTKEALERARSAFQKDKEITYFFLLKYLHMSTELRAMIYSGNTYANTGECFDQIVEVTADYNDAAIVTEQLKRELELEYSRAREIRAGGQLDGMSSKGAKFGSTGDIRSSKTSLRRSSSTLLEIEPPRRTSSSSVSLSVDSNQSIENIGLDVLEETDNGTEEMVTMRPKREDQPPKRKFKSLVNRVRGERRNSTYM